MDQFDTNIDLTSISFLKKAGRRLALYLYEPSSFL